MQAILADLAPNSTCAIVFDEGLRFRTNESACVETKRKLVDECELWAIVQQGRRAAASLATRRAWLADQG
ncbi:MAG: SAM-dependent methyltransferase [Chromatiales bacterium]|nr:SAM-dependent methyltransferase [Chromatiales bacterium]